jgi:hypothetical protein
VRDFVEKEVLPFVQQWEEEHISTGKEFPLDVIHRAAAAGIYAPQYVASDETPCHWNAIGERIMLQAHWPDRRSARLAWL